MENTPQTFHIFGFLLTIFSLSPWFEREKNPLGICKWLWFNAAKGLCRRQPCRALGTPCAIMKSHLLPSRESVKDGWVGRCFLRQAGLYYFPSLTSMCCTIWGVHWPRHLPQLQRLRGRWGAGAGWHKDLFAVDQLLGSEGPEPFRHCLTKPSITNGCPDSAAGLGKPREVDVKANYESHHGFMVTSAYRSSTLNKFLQALRVS